jgi:predicted MPP superfamily phosphohydrolase
MYLQKEFILATPVMLYACLRFRSFIDHRILRNVSVFVFLCLAAGYPVAESLSHGPGKGWTEIVMLAGYYALPLLLYLVMAVALADLALGALRLTGLLSREAAKSARFRKLRLIAVMAIPALVTGLGIVNYNVLRVKEYRVEVPRKSSKAGEMTIVFMADLHLRASTPGRVLESLVRKVNAQKADIVLVGGDILEGDRRDEDFGRYERLFRRMESKFGVYAVPGNHEGYRRVDPGFFERSGVRLLEDVSEEIAESFLLVGRKDSRSRSRRSVADILGGASRNLPVILLVHRPTFFGEAVRAGVDIQLSGHTHHGQLFPANFMTSRQYPLSWGHIRRGQTHLFVTSGVQGWGPPVRTAGRSEIVVLKVDFRGDV